MFDVRAYQNPFLTTSQNVMQAVLSVTCLDDVVVEAGPAPLSLSIVIDRSASMGGAQIDAARDAAIQVVQAADEHVLLMVVAFDDTAEVLVPPMTCDAANKKAAVAAIGRLQPNGSTCMSRGLSMVVRHMTPVSEGRVRKILFLTDGKNDGENHRNLEQAVTQCRKAEYEVTAWGVGAAWDERELNFIADGTLGKSNMIPTAAEIRTAFTSSFAEMRRLAANNVRLHLWTPLDVHVRSIQQVFPVVRTLHADTGDQIPLGSLARGEQRDYLVELAVPAHPPGQQYVISRPILSYEVPGRGRVEEKAAREGWVFLQPTLDATQAAPVDPHVAHYTHQEQLASVVHAALAEVDAARATQLLGQALQLSRQGNNKAMTEMLTRVVAAEGNGTARLKNASVVERKTLALHAGKTTRLK